MRIIFSLGELLPRSEQGKLGVLLLLIVAGGFLEVFGVGVLFPYVLILQDPSRILQNVHLRALYQSLNLGSDQLFLIAISAGLLAVFCLKAMFAILLASFQARFVNDVQTQLGQRLLRHYFSRPYEFFLSENTANLVANLTTTVSQVSAVVQAGLVLAAELLSFLGLLIFLVWLSPLFSIIAFIFAATTALTLLKSIRKSIERYAKENDGHWKAMIRKGGEALTGIKEIKVLGRERYFIDNFNIEARAYGHAIRRYSVLSQLPRIVLESSAIAMLVAFAVFAIVSHSTGPDVFAVLSVFAAATIRLVPNVYRVIQAWNSINFYRPAVTIIMSSLGKENERHRFMTTEHQIALPLVQDVTLSVKAFSHVGNPHFQLRDITLNVARGEKIAIVGHSGSGKSTLLDILLGLFPEFAGHLTVDGYDCRGKERMWQRTIGYVPQSVMMLDDSIKRNVAFGITDAMVDVEAVTRAISLAGLEQVVRTQPAGLDTVIGDRGVRLSGGERQRIGIARALYSDPPLLILDEATSALDNQTERQIVESILALSPAKTIIIIAHRMSSVKLCDRLYLMNMGRLIDVGSFDEIAARHPNFVDPELTRDV